MENEKKTASRCKVLTGANLRIPAYARMTVTYRSYLRTISYDDMPNRIVFETILSRRFPGGIHSTTNDGVAISRVDLHGEAAGIRACLLFQNMNNKP